MLDQPNWLSKARFYSSVTTIYIVTLLFAAYIFRPFFVHPPLVEALKSLPISSAPAPVKIISGLPTRIVVPSQGLDLPVDLGVYNLSDNSWSLSGYHAQYAVGTPLANNHDGNTFLYGHNNKYVFGHLRFLNPGDKVLIYTDNNHLFTYNYIGALNVNPDDTSVFHYQGPPMMTIQTCSGDWNEWRRMYKFNLDKIEQ